MPLIKGDLKMKKAAALICSLIISCSLFTACGDEDSNKGNIVALSSGDESSVNDKSSNESSDEKAASTEISKDWKSLEIIMDGTKYTMNFNYSDLTKISCSFDPALYGLTDAVLKPGIMYSPDIYLNNDKFGDGFMRVGLMNATSEDVGLDGTQVWAVGISKVKKDKAPDITLPGDITWGADEAAVKAAYGDPAETSDGDGFVKYSYTEEGIAKLELSIYADGGLKEVYYQHG